MRWFPERGSQLTASAWVESLVIVLVVLGLGFFLRPQDPFFFQADFPWLWFAPLLVALRYGMAPAMMSIVLLAAAWLLARWAGHVAGDFPLLPIAGGALLTLVSAQFSTVWNQRLRRAKQVASHAEERFEQLSRAYFMVRQSHDRLEQNLISKPVTLRQAMMDLRQLLSRTGGGLQRETATELLGILSTYCSLESAAIHEVVNEKVTAEPLAFCGRGGLFVEDDQLLKAAMESGNMAYQAANRLRREERSHYLVTAPVRSSSGNLYGMLTVTEMPFMELHRETLQVLAVLIAYVADHAEAVSAAKPILDVYPDCSGPFAAELLKMVRLHRELGVPSTLVRVSIPTMPQLENICTVLKDQQRGLDHTWQRHTPAGVQFITLMPFAGMGAAEGYRTRISEILVRRFRFSLQDEPASFHSVIIADAEPLTQLEDLLEEVKV
ncbi:MAG: PelD GGDEF domain-containing protein [Desulfuromonadales bacterium]|uniref:PelD GGDEF domain-containing protein n=1 Tax=Desulfuromonas sp. KJ2020 TaxID=2919173 RepID=UPI0020A77EF9|nr:PelD GGDEF domain-containing protein [Desulfuromonas sp. KJ2020]MCP3176796.1 PelD GGDEF domain-containing protein [Desulfuromonas sp. KJ2020]